MAQKVRDVMTPGPATLPREAPLTEAARVMRDHGIGDVLVIEGTQLCGVVTDRDIVVRAVADGRDMRGTRLGDVCSASLVTLGPDDEADSAVRLMRQMAIRRIPVVECGRPVGIVSIGDLPTAQAQVSALSDITRAPPNL